MLMSGGGGVKHVYRGITSGAGNVTLPAPVNMDKTVVLSASKGSSGYVAARGTITMPDYNLRGWDGYNGNSIVTINLGDSTGDSPLRPLISPSNNLNPIIPNGSGSISGGTTNLTVKEYSARLVDENTIYCDGPVEWQVIEYN